MSPTVRKVDTQGRIALPGKWRAKALGKSDEVVVIERGDTLVVRPRSTVDLTAYFDLVPVEVNPKAFANYNRLKRALLQGERVAIR